MRKPGFTLVAFAALGVFTCIGTAMAQDSSGDATAQYREMLEDGNPADLWVTRGEGLWKEKRGPKQVSLEHCDLGLGPGVVKGAYAQLPRYFKDTDKVQDLESRLVTCMVTQQGYSEAEAKKNHFSKEDGQSDMEALVAYIADTSRGAKINVPQSHPKEREAYRVGEQIFYYRAGPHDFSCATCHSESGKRIRLQSLANLTDPKEAAPVFGAWPAYRGSQGTVRSMEHRIYDCLRQQRMPPVEYGSDLVTALTVYLGKNANGGMMNAPGMKR
ncbi:SoxAX cytochrome complex subunit A [Pandoraea terrae]|uniref:SoxAX cytochrome complex subunit A n=1 Tax=Pandoraea terrae TaxID=1537710 RepID=A0A5E4Y1G0_9BURK|nr:sulfur oxidation c-type cytochrome SoxA [Pandoraea terrae]VVE42377.1 SoxAX cytochrome complex subunit A [Pandoraea terrae]